MTIGRRVLVLAVFGMGLAACDTPRNDAAASPPVAHEPQGRIDRAPLPPPPGGDASSGSGMAAAPGNPPGEPAGGMVWKSSPRWAAIKGNDKLEDDPGTQ